MTQKKYSVRTVNTIPADSTGNVDVTGAIISVTKEELNTLVLANELKVGSTYKISGVHPELYDDGTNAGTTIYLQALTSNTLSKSGHGEFWNPKYDPYHSTFGIWNNLSSWNAVQTFRPTMTSVNEYIGSQSVSDSQGNIFAAHTTGTGIIYKIDKTTNVASTFATLTLPVVECLRIDSSDNLYAICDRVIYKITPAGVITGINAPGSLLSNDKIFCISPTGDFYVGNYDNANIKKVTSAGVITTLANYSTVGFGIGDLCSDASGNVYVLITGSNKVAKITADGTSVTQYGLTGSVPRKIIIDSTGIIYTLNAGSGTITKMLGQGSYIHNYATLGPNDNSLRSFSFAGDGIIYAVRENSLDIMKVVTGDTPVVSVYATQTNAATNSYSTSVTPNGTLHVIGSASRSKLVPAPIGVFENNEVVTANNGATGKLFGDLSRNKFYNLTGDWYLATSITGNTSGMKADIASVNTQYYSAGDVGKWTAVRPEPTYVTYNTGADPMRFAKDSLNNLFIVNSGASKTISKITPAGVVTTSPVTYQFPLDICVDSTNNAFVACDKGVIQKWGTDGVLTTFVTLPEPNAAIANFQANGMCIDSNNNLYLSYATSNNSEVIRKIYKITPAGTISTFYNTTFENDAISVDSLNNIYITDPQNLKVWKVTPAGVGSVFATTVGIPTGAVAFDQWDHGYIAHFNNNTVTKMTQAGDVTVFATVGGNPMRVVIDSIGNLYTANRTSYNVSMITLDGVVTTVVSLGFQPYGCISMGDGRLFINDVNADLTYKYYNVNNFMDSEGFVANNGATGILYNKLSDNRFKLLTGNITGLTSITGNTSKSIANISAPYILPNKTIWGGYSWTSNEGKIGGVEDVLTLDSNWTKNPYNSTDYNKVIDYIEYDYSMDWITRRLEVEFDNDVHSSYQEASWTWGASTINVFQFGNGLGHGGPSRGLMGNRIYFSYIELINFSGNCVVNNIFTDECYAYENSFLEDSRIVGNYFSNTNIGRNTFIGSYIKHNQFTCSNNQLYRNYFYANTIQDNIFSGMDIEYNVMRYGQMQDNTFHTSRLYNQDTNSSIKRVTCKNAYMMSNISPGTILFDTNIQKEVYSRPDGATKLRYYNNSDVLVITDITT